MVPPDTVRSGSGRSAVARQRAGGRSERVRRQVAEAVLALISEGHYAPTAGEVAKRSGVHRSTVYHWWPTTADLLREALAMHTARLHVSDTGNWAGDLRELACALAEFFADPVEMAMNAGMAAGADAQFDAVQVEHWLPIMQELSAVVDRAKRRGEIRSDTDSELVMHLLVSPLLVQTVLLHVRPGATLVDRIADTVGRAFAI